MVLNHSKMRLLITLGSYEQNKVYIDAKLYNKHFKTIFTCTINDLYYEKV